MNEEQAEIAQKALACLKAGQIDAAFTQYESLLLNDNIQAEEFRLGAIAALHAGHIDQAINWLKNAVEMAPSRPGLHLDLARTLRIKGRLDAALDAYRHSLSLDGQCVDAYMEMAAILWQSERAAEAIDILQSALTACSNTAKLNQMLGIVLMEEGCYHQARSHLDKAPKDDAQTRYADARLLEHEGKIEAAVGRLSALVRDEPGYSQAVHRLVRLKRNICDWDGLEIAETALSDINDAEIAAGRRPPEHPMEHMFRCDNPEANAKIAKAWTEYIAGDVVPLSQCFQVRSEDKIRIAYLTGQIFAHPVASSLANLISAHNRDKVSIAVFAWGKRDNSSTCDIITTQCDRFTDINHLNDAEAAARIREDDIDVLFDLTGLSEDSRIGILARRPARFQIGYYGHLGTCGGSHLDGLIVDNVLVPELSYAHYAERLFPFDSGFALLPRSDPGCVPARSDYGLPEEAIVFASFNQVTKLDPRTFDLWLSILKDVPDSILWLMAEEPARTNLRKYMAGYGLNPERLVFAEKVGVLDHRARLQLADIGLDTLAYTGGATSGDLLSQGVPVVTLTGKGATARMTTSILHHLGCQDLATSSVAAYKNCAVALARETECRVRYRRQLHRRAADIPMFSPEKYVAELEAFAYRLVKDGS